MSRPEQSNHDYEQIETITVVGGGDSGLLTALIVKKILPAVDVTVIDDFNEEIPEVGKSTITYILYTLHDILEIDIDRFVSEVRPVWKASVYFKDWCGVEPFHVPFDEFTLQPNYPGGQRFEVLYYRYVNRHYKTLGEELAERKMSPVTRENYYDRRIGDSTLYDQVAYHLSTRRYNAFLRDLSRERGINLVDDTIADVWTKDNWIEGIASNSTEYESDLYIDASGFKRALMGKLQNDFREFEFPLDSTLVAKTDIPISDIVPATVITSADRGWYWQIDTYDCRDLGYVFSSAHASNDEAVTEFIEDHEDISESDIQLYRFNSGIYENAWMNNCLAVGNALGFVEPLQSTALTVNALLSEEFSKLLADHYLINHGGLRSIYNSYAQAIWNNVYNFVSIHYQYSSGSNEFWRSMQSVDGGERLSRYIESYQANGFNSFEKSDTQITSTISVFSPYSFYKVLRSLGVKSRFYEGLDLAISPEVKSNIKQNDERASQRVSEHLSHEEVYDEFISG